MHTHTQTQSPSLQPVVSAQQIENTARYHLRRLNFDDPRRVRGTFIANAFAFTFAVVGLSSAGLRGARVPFDGNLPVREFESDSADEAAHWLLQCNADHYAFHELHVQHMARALVLPAAVFAQDLRRGLSVDALMDIYPFAAERFIEARRIDLEVFSRAPSQLLSV